MKRYRAILLDPPWDFDVWSQDTGQGRAAEAHYPTMSLDQLAALPVRDLMDDDCAVFMWFVWPRMPDALVLADAWGLQYKTLAFDWLKRTSTGRAWHMGMGYWSRANSEGCLLFTKGSPKRKGKGVRQLIPDVGQLSMFEPMVEPVGDHSAKPLETYLRIEALVDGPYLELFARIQVPGWDTWGFDAPNPIDWSPDVSHVRKGEMNLMLRQKRYLAALRRQRRREGRDRWTVRRRNIIDIMMREEDTCGAH